MKYCGKWISLSAVIWFVIRTWVGAHFASARFCGDWDATGGVSEREAFARDLQCLTDGNTRPVDSVLEFIVDRIWWESATDEERDERCRFEEATF